MDFWFNILDSLQQEVNLPWLLCNPFKKFIFWHFFITPNFIFVFLRYLSKLVLYLQVWACAFFFIFKVLSISNSYLIRQNSRLGSSSVQIIWRVLVNTWLSWLFWRSSSRLRRKIVILAHFLHRFFDKRQRLQLFVASKYAGVSCFLLCNSK